MFISVIISSNKGEIKGKRCILCLILFSFIIEYYFFLSLFLILGVFGKDAIKNSFDNTGAVYIYLPKSVSHELYAWLLTCSNYALSSQYVLQQCRRAKRTKRRVYILVKQEGMCLKHYLLLI